MDDVYRLWDELADFGAARCDEALVVDGRTLPSGTRVDLSGVDFAAIQGALTVNTHSSADTPQSIVCDSAA